MIRLVPATYTPTEWFIAFRRTSTLPLLNRLPFMRYRHVLCFGQVPGGPWVFYDFGAAATTLLVIPDNQANFAMKQATDDALVLAYAPKSAPAGLRLKPWFVCTTAVAHLTGVPSCALRPDAFLRDCIAAGATIVASDEPEPDHQTRPDARSRESCGEERQDRCHPQPRLVTD